MNPRLEALLRETCPDAELPPFEVQGFHRATESAARNQQPLLIFLYQPRFSPLYLSTVLFTPAAASILRENFTVMLVDPEHPEFAPLAEKTGAQPPPALMALHMLSQEQQVILGVMAGEETLTAGEVIEFLDRTLMQAEFVARETEARPAPNQAKIVQDRLYFPFRIRQEQETALREAERIAQERERKAREEAQRRLQEQEEQRQQAENLLRLKAQKRESVGPEPADSPEIVKIAFRMPDGSKNQRNFEKTDTVGKLYDYIDSLEGELGAFELATSFPSHSLSNKDSSLESEGLYPRAVLHIRQV